MTEKKIDDIQRMNRIQACITCIKARHVLKREILYTLSQHFQNQFNLNVPELPRMAGHLTSASDQSELGRPADDCPMSWRPIESCYQPRDREGLNCKKQERNYVINTCSVSLKCFETQFRSLKMR